MKTPEVRLDAKTVAKNLVSICGGKKEAISTLTEGGKRLSSDSSFGNLLFNVSQEISSVRPESQDAFKYRHAGRTRKGGGPSIRRFL